MTLVTLAVVFAYFTHPDNDNSADADGGRRSRRYGYLRSTLIVLAAVPIAIITNAGRVSGTGVLSHYYGTEVADGFFHSFSGWVVYIVAFLLLFGFGWLIDRFNPTRRAGPARAAAGSPPRRFRRWTHPRAPRRSARHRRSSPKALYQSAAARAASPRSNLVPVLAL